NQIEHIETILGGVDGVESYSVSRAYTLTLTGVREGDTVLSPEALGERMVTDGGLRPLREVMTATDGDGNEVAVDDDEVIENAFEWIERQASGVDARSLDQL